MNRIVSSTLLMALCLGSAPMVAQGGRAAMGPPAQAMVRQRIVQILMNQARNTLALSEDQVPKLQRAVGEWAQKQLMLEQEEHLMRQALDSQMRPGIAAVADSLPKLVYGISANRVKQAQSLDDETHALGAFLTPVQLGQFQIIQERLLKNIRDLPKGRQPKP